MAILRDRHNPVRLFGRRLLILGLIVLVVLGISGVWSAYKKEKASSALRAEAEVQLADLATRQSQLNADIANLGSDRGKEEALREQYALAAKGEKLIIIVDPHASGEVHATSSLMQWIKKTFSWW